jgi:Transposase
MPRHCSHSIDFKRQVVAEYHAGETLHALGRRHDLSRNLIRIWVEKAEAGSLDQDMASAELLGEYETRIAALELLKGLRKRTVAEKRAYICDERPRGLSIERGCALMGVPRYWTGFAPVSYGGNLTWSISAPTAAGDPTAFCNAAGVNIVVYRSGDDSHILSLYWADGPSGLDNLSGVAGSPPAAGDPFAYYTAHDDTHQVVNRVDNGDLYELYWAGAAPVDYLNLSAISGAPAASGNAAAYYSTGTNTKHVIYRSADSRLHEIWWVPGVGTPAYVDLTALAAAPPAADRPAAFTVEGPNSQHVAYRGSVAGIPSRLLKKRRVRRAERRRRRPPRPWPRRFPWSPGRGSP